MIVVVDDNYCALKMASIGIQAGANYSTFSGFKLLGPEGIGVVVGNGCNRNHSTSKLFWW